MNSLKIGVAQITSIDDVEANIDMIFRLLQKLEPGEVHSVFFPENSLYMRIKEGEPLAEFELSHPAFQALSEWAQKQNTAIHLGSVPLKLNQALYNASVWIPPHGAPEASYTKTHLFDIELEGQRPIRESDVFDYGSGPSVLQIGPWNIGQSICYDVRFSNLYHAYALLGVQAITVPSAFLVKTGQAHWEVLLRARAIESQCYVIASAQSGVHKSLKGQRETYGHSMVIDPWGQKILEISETPALKTVELQLGEVDRVRRQIPMKNHRRGPF